MRAASMRGWDFGEPGQKFPCWIVLDHLPTNTCIAYCENGFGPSYPWGLLFIKGQHLSMGEVHAIQEQLGHRDINTTRIYLRLTSEDVMREVAKIDF